MVASLSGFGHVQFPPSAGVHREVRAMPRAERREFVDRLEGRLAEATAELGAVLADVPSLERPGLRSVGEATASQIRARGTSRRSPDR